MSSERSENNLADLRLEIDMLDEQILQSIRDRIDTSKKISAEKQKLKMAIYQQTREAEKKQHIHILAQHYGLDEAIVTEIYELLLAYSRSVQ